MEIKNTAVNRDTRSENCGTMTEMIKRRYTFDNLLESVSKMKEIKKWQRNGNIPLRRS